MPRAGDPAILDSPSFALYKHLMTQKRRTLLVGAGAVGQVYGRHLAQGGADVTFYAKPKYERGLRDGLRLRWLNKGQTIESWGGFEVLTSPAAVADAPLFDEVWLCVSATAILGDWLPTLLQAAGRPVVVALQPGFETATVLGRHVSPDRLVQGLISMVSYEAPLQDPDRAPDEASEAEDECVAYWFPPLGPSQFSGPDQATRDVVRGLKRGRCPARRVAHAGAASAVGSAFLMPVVTGLEGADWSLSRFIAGDFLGLSCRAAREGIRAVARHLDVSVPGYRHLLTPRLAGPIFRFAAAKAPFDFEKYFKYHFTKVGDQTRHLMASYIDLAAETGFPNEALALLSSTVFDVEPPRAG